LDHLRAASSIEVGQSLPLAFLRRSHHTHTQRSSALDVEQGQSSSCLPPLILYSPPRTFFLSGILHHYYYSTIHLFTIFTISVHTHTHTHLSTPGAPVERELFGRGCPFSSPICIQDPGTQTHTHKRNLETVAADEQNISLSKEILFYFLSQFRNDENKQFVRVCVCMYVGRGEEHWRVSFA
jgi:hypothetical protein